jgi:L-iditol 2-dehydrogenase
VARAAAPTLSNADPAAVLYGPRDLRLEQREIADPGERELLIEVSAVGICGSDVHYFEHGALGPNVIRGPHILGHEFSGRVVGAGRSASGPAIGARVTVEPGVPCGACAQCRSDHYNLCEHPRFLGAPPTDGALRGHVAVDANFGGSGGDRR